MAPNPDDERPELTPGFMEEIYECSPTLAFLFACILILVHLVITAVKSLIVKIVYGGVRLFQTGNNLRKRFLRWIHDEAGENDDVTTLISDAGCGAKRRYKKRGRYSYGRKYTFTNWLLYPIMEEEESQGNASDNEVDKLKKASKKEKPSDDESGLSMFCYCDYQRLCLVCSGSIEDLNTDDSDLVQSIMGNLFEDKTLDNTNDETPEFAFMPRRRKFYVWRGYEATPLSYPVEICDGSSSDSEDLSSSDEDSDDAGLKSAKPRDFFYSGKNLYIIFTVAEFDLSEDESSGKCSGKRVEKHTSSGQTCTDPADHWTGKIFLSEDKFIEGVETVGNFEENPDEKTEGELLKDEEYKKKRRSETATIMYDKIMWSTRPVNDKLGISAAVRYYPDSNEEN